LSTPNLCIPRPAHLTRTKRPTPGVLESAPHHPCGNAACAVSVDGTLHRRPVHPMAANASDERKASSGDAPSHRAPRLTSARRSVSSVPTRSSRTGSGAGAGAGAGAGTRKARGGIDYGGGSFDGRKQPVSSKIRRRSLGTPLGRVQSMRSMMRGRGQQVPLQVGPRRSATPSLEEQHHSLLQEFLRHAKSADHRGDGDATLEAMGLEELSVSSMVDAVKTASLEHSNQKYTFAMCVCQCAVCCPGRPCLFCCCLVHGVVWRAVVWR